MKIDWWTLALQAVNAAVLIWLLAHFLFRPVADIIAARQKAAQQLLADASAAKAAAQSERDKAKAENEKLAEHRNEALKAVEAEAATEKAELLAAAQAEAEKLPAAAEASGAGAGRGAADRLCQGPGCRACRVAGRSAGLSRCQWDADQNYGCPRIDRPRGGGVPDSPGQDSRTSGPGRVRHRSQSHRRPGAGNPLCLRTQQLPRRPHSPPIRVDTP